MINQNPESIIFRYAGTNSRTLDCSYVDYGFEIIGDIDEKIDNLLVENYENVRLLIECELVLFLTDALWFSNFLISTDKFMTVDGSTLQIVNDFKNIKFPRWEDFSLAVKVKIKFKNKIPGLPEGWPA